MSEPLKYSFAKPGWGELDLELDEASKQVYNSTLPETIPFKIEGLDSKEEIRSLYFFEWQKIQYNYTNGEDSQFRPPFELRVNERCLKKSVSKSKVHLLTGQFSFNDTVGETNIQIRDSENKLVFNLQTEVFPQKMDYKSDYKAMVEDISSIIQNLAVDSLKDTFRKSRAKLSGHATEHEWWNILDVLFDQIIVSLNVIKRQPRHEIKTDKRVLPVEKIKQASKDNLNWLRKNSQYANKKASGLKFGERHYFTHALSSKKYVSYDTYENRFVAWAVKNVIEQLRKYHQHTEANKGNKDYAQRLRRMKDYQSRLQGILHTNPLNEVGEFEKRSHFSTSLTRGAGYRDFMHVYLFLIRGLEITNNDIFKIEQKDISTLYEYWCFLMLVKLLKEQNKNIVDFQDLIKIRAGKFKVELVKGEPSKVKFKKPNSTETTTIYFNREFTKDKGKTLTYNQKPDYAIEFKKDGYVKPFWYLFDAKYRFEEHKQKDLEIKNNYNVPQDAIGQLHRYRDAILHTQSTNSSYRSAIKNLGGIILYPYPLSEETFKQNDYYKSIAEVNIGAMPFLSSKTGLVNDFLSALINRTPDEHFEQFIEMDRSEYDQKRGMWNEWVTISVIPLENQSERLKFIEEKALFHVPYIKDANSKLFRTKKVLLCKSNSLEAFLYDVERWEILDNQELNAIGTTWNHRANKYVAFHLANRKEISTPSKIVPSKFRYATNEGLTKFLKDPLKDKNAFYLTSQDAARLYDELKMRKIEFDLNWGNDDSDPSLIEFSIDGLIVQSSDSFKFLNFSVGGKLIILNEILNQISSRQERI